MTGDLRDLRGDYEQVVRDYLAGGGEAARARAYEIGRAAMARGLGTLELAALHHEALCDACTARGDTRTADTVRAAQDVLLDSLSPFELAYRGALQANALLRRLNERSEQQTCRIAHALHDEAGQLLTLIHLALAEWEAELPPELRGRSNRIGVLLDRFESELRVLSHELRPRILDDLGLVPALELLIKGISTRSGLPIELVGSTGGRLSLAVETALYRIVQEALTNVSRHAEAKRARVELDRTAAGVRCTVTDDGRGFDVRADGARGLGLLGIEERVEALGGRLELHSTLGTGTKLAVSLPHGGDDGDPRPAR